MKLNKILTSLSAVALFGMASCSEGQYWEEVQNPTEIYAFAKPSETVVISSSEEMPSVYNIIISRNVAGGEETIPVSFSTDWTELSAPSSVTFPAGSYTAEFPISIADNTIVGEEYTATLKIAMPEGNYQVSTNNLSCAFKISKDYTWQDMGTVKLSDTLWGVSGADVPIQECMNYKDPIPGYKLMRLVSPYWYMGIADEKNCDLWLWMDDDYNIVTTYQPWTYTGAFDDEDGFYWFYGYNFANNATTYMIAGYVGCSDDSEEAPASPSYYENLTFVWNRN